MSQANAGAAALAAAFAQTLNKCCPDFRENLTENCEILRVYIEAESSGDEDDKTAIDTLSLAHKYLDIFRHDEESQRNPPDSIGRLAEEEDTGQ